VVSTLAKPPTLELASGRQVEVTSRDEGDWIVVRGKEGACVLTVLMTDSGPVLRFESAAIELSAPRSIDINCDAFRVAAREEVSVAARSIDLRANGGGVQVRADDDVTIDGERVLLNSSDGPTQLSWDEYFERTRALGASPPAKK
jgi:phage gp45-like